MSHLSIVFMSWFSYMAAQQNLYYVLTSTGTFYTKWHYAILLLKHIKTRLGQKILRGGILRLETH